MVKDIFVNLPVQDLPKSMEFFRKLGFEFNPQFTDTQGASLVLAEHIYVMLLTREFFQTFTKKELADSTKQTEVITAIGVESREKVDELVSAALAAGGAASNEKQDYGWMYAWSFQDLDGHMWEVVYTDPKGPPQE